MMRSMYSGVSGLRVHQSKMDVIGNNIANVNTTGFKASRVTFNEVFNQTIQGASGSSESTGMGGRNPMQVGLGSTVGSIDVSMTEGAAQRTDNPMDLKIQGDGFFVVKSTDGYYFTRAGAFKADNMGNLVTSEGLKVMGWKPDSNGNITRREVQELNIFGPQNSYADPAQTQNANLTGNIDIDKLESMGSYKSNLRFYDNLGYSYTAELDITKNAEDAIDVSLSAIVDSEGNDIMGGAALSGSPVTVKFDAATGRVDTTVLSAFDINNIDTKSGLQNISVDVSGLTLFAGSLNIDSERGNLTGSGAGREAGSLSGFDVGQDGKIVGRYTNGEIRELGQIVIQTFKNPSGLQKVGNNLFSQTSNSGEFDGIGQDPTATGGSLSAGVLEMSNVDLSKEFTEMITTQRGFQANSKIITTSDEMLQELVNLKR